jgi:hypothetical protein
MVVVMMIWTSLDVVASGVTRVVYKPDIDPKSGIDMEVESWLERCPVAGVVPLTWRAVNGTGSDLTWQMEMVSGRSYGSTEARVSSYTLTVPAGQKGEVDLYVPVSKTHPGYYGGSDLQWKVTGHGVRNGGSLSNFGRTSSETEFVGMGEGAAAKGGWSALESELHSGGKGRDLRGSEVDMSKAPEDWRGYMGLAQLWVTDREWLKVSELARLAVLDWVGFGGRMFVLVEDESVEHAKVLGLPPLWSQGHPLGAGMVRRVKWDGKTLPLKEVARLVKEDGQSLKKSLEEYDEHWALIKQMGRLELNTPLVFGFIVLFGLLVGPVNLFWFAGGGRRSRLFWTTPLLSVGGSLLLMGLMIVQDGFGGTGTRQVLVMLQSENKRMGVVQEQVSKTGVLMSRAFAKGEPMMLTPLNVEARRWYSQSKDEYRETNQHASGAWFSSRAIQAQLLQSVRPTRAAVEFFAAPQQGGAPEVLSSVGVLEEVFVVDEGGRAWKVTDLGTGERKLMEAVDTKLLESWIKDRMKDRAGPVMASVIEGVKMRPGYVYAASSQVGDLAMESLDSIRWESHRLLVVGPVLRGGE